jgi:ubiquinone/menaquinone biosynthesis C-methylase UbiE
MAGFRDGEMRRFWNARAREDAFYFVDTRQRYRARDRGRFWEAADLVEFMLSELEVELCPRDTVLEIGCGIGRITRALAGRCAEVIALDISDEMLRRARELNPQLENVRWVQGNGETLAGIESETIDACMSVVVLQHVPDPEITLGYVRELGRVLRRSVPRRLSGSARGGSATRPGWGRTWSSRPSRPPRATAGRTSSVSGGRARSTASCCCESQPPDERSPSARGDPDRRSRSAAGGDRRDAALQADQRLR